MKTKSLCLVLIGAVALISCQSPSYVDPKRSRTAMFGDNLFRYGSMAAGGAGGYFVGDSLSGGNKMIGGLGAAAGVGLTYALHKVYDKKQQESYDYGVIVGKEQGREELVNDMWLREAVYGLPSEGEEGGNATMVRNIYVPSRTINNVRYNSGYQQVLLR